MDEEKFTLSDVDKLLKEQYEHAMATLKTVRPDPFKEHTARLELGRCYNDLRLRIRGA